MPMPIEYDDPRDHLNLIWQKLHAYQEEMIPFDKYESGFRLQDSDPMKESMIATYEMYREEWDNICFAMARLAEMVGVAPEEVGDE